MALAGAALTAATTATKAKGISNAGLVGSAALAPRNIGSGLIAANASKSINKSNQEFIREMYGQVKSEYATHGVPFVPGLTTGGGGTPLPKHNQQIGNRSYTSTIGGLQPNYSNSPLNLSMGLTKLS